MQNKGFINDEGIDLSDIPEVTDVSKWRKNPERAKRLKNGYTIIVEREGYNEVRKYDFTKIPKPSKGLPIPYEVTIEKQGTPSETNGTERIENGHCVNINRETLDEVREYVQSDDFLGLFDQPGLKSVNLTVGS